MLAGILPTHCAAQVSQWAGKHQPLVGLVTSVQLIASLRGPFSLHNQPAQSWLVYWNLTFNMFSESRWLSLGSGRPVIEGWGGGGSDRGEGDWEDFRRLAGGGGGGMRWSPPWKIGACAVACSAPSCWPHQRDEVLSPTFRHESFLGCLWCIECWRFRYVQKTCRKISCFLAGICLIVNA